MQKALFEIALSRAFLFFKDSLLCEYHYLQNPFDILS